MNVWFYSHLVPFSFYISCKSQSPLANILCVHIPITCFVPLWVIPDLECTSSFQRSGLEVLILFVLRVSFHLAARGEQAGTMWGEGDVFRSSTSLDLTLSYNSTTTFTAQDVSLAIPHPSEYSDWQVCWIHFRHFLQRNKTASPRSHRIPVEKLQTERNLLHFNDWDMLCRGLKLLMLYVKHLSPPLQSVEHFGRVSFFRMFVCEQIYL